MATIPQLQIPQMGAVSGGADFAPLANLGQLYQKYQQGETNKAALAAFQQTGDPRALIGSGDMNLAQLGISAQNHLDALKQQAIENKRADINVGLSQAAGARAAAGEARTAADWEKAPDQYIPNPKAGQPGEPAYIDQYAAATAASGNPAKPIPFETLGGTKFLVPQPGGGYKAVDPAELLNPGGGAPVAQGQQPAVPNPSVFSSGSGASYSADGRSVVSPAAPQAPQQQPAVAVDKEAIDPQTGRREDFLKSLDPQVQGYIKKIADYEIDPRTTSVKGGMREKLMAAVAQYDPTYNQNEFGTRTKAMKDFGTGQQGNSVRSFDVAMDHLDTLKTYVKALDSGDSRLINELRNKWLEATGSPLPTNLQAIGPVVGAEVTKAIIGSNNALADREELRAPLKASNSIPQILGAIGGYQSLMGGQLKGLKKQYEDTTGKKDFDKRVSDNTRKVLLEHSGVGGGGDAKADPLGIR